jgi:tuftelin-interacting protein 11
MVYPTIRRKLANALVHWHPSDASGKQILTPWVTVFSKGSMDAFILKNILPKLQLAMQSLIINPNNQILGMCSFL